MRLNTTYVAARVMEFPPPDKGQITLVLEQRLCLLENVLEGDDLEKVRSLAARGMGALMTVICGSNRRRTFQEQRQTGLYRVGFKLLTHASFWPYLSGLDDFKSRLGGREELLAMWFSWSDMRLL